MSHKLGTIYYVKLFVQSEASCESLDTLSIGIPAANLDTSNSVKSHFKDANHAKDICMPWILVL
jgi:hypothetical protein